MSTLFDRRTTTGNVPKTQLIVSALRFELDLCKQKRVFAIFPTFN